MSSITAVLNSAEYLLYFCPFLLIKNMHLRKCLTFGVHIILCSFQFAQFIIPYPPSNNKEALIVCRSFAAMAGIAKERRITSTNTLEMSFFMKSPPNIFLLLKIQQLCSLLFTHIRRVPARRYLLEVYRPGQAARRPPSAFSASEILSVPALRH